MSKFYICLMLLLVSTTLVAAEKSEEAEKDSEEMIEFETLEEEATTKQEVKKEGESKKATTMKEVKKEGESKEKGSEEGPPKSLVEITTEMEQARSPARGLPPFYKDETTSTTERSKGNEGPRAALITLAMLFTWAKLLV